MIHYIPIIDKKKKSDIFNRIGLTAAITNYAIDQQLYTQIMDFYVFSTLKKGCEQITLALILLGACKKDLLLIGYDKSVVYKALRAIKVARIPLSSEESGKDTTKVARIPLSSEESGKDTTKVARIPLSPEESGKDTTKVARIPLSPEESGKDTTKVARIPLSPVNQLTNLNSSNQIIGDLEKEELRKRIETLEQQNQFLFQLLQKQQGIQNTPSFPISGTSVISHTSITDSPAVNENDKGTRKPHFVTTRQETQETASAVPMKEKSGTTKNILDQIPKGYEQCFEQLLQHIVDHLVKLNRKYISNADKLDYRKVSPALLHRLVFLRVRDIAGEKTLSLSEADWIAMINDDCKATLKERRIKFIGAAFLKTLQEFYILNNWDWTAISPPSVEWKQEQHHARVHNHQPRVQYFPNENTRLKEKVRYETIPLLAKDNVPSNPVCGFRKST